MVALDEGERNGQLHVVAGEVLTRSGPEAPGLRDM